MDKSARPWRVLDDSVAAGATGPGGGPGSATIDGAPVAPSGRPDGPDRASAVGISGRLIAGIVAAASLAAAAFVFAASGSSGGGVTVDSAGLAVDGSARPSAGSAVPLGGDLVVDVQGAVPQPGVHHLAAGSRVADAIAAAGGYGPRVDAERAGRELNLAAQLHDGDRVLVPSRDDPPGTSGSGSTGDGGAGGGGAGTSRGSGAGALVDLNHATASELDALPGVGPVTAQKIIAAREEQPFATIEALRDRKVVGSAAFEKLKDLVTVTP
jgi:competence protein ComEA